jgi:Tfp pilus assembly protein PilE
MMMVVAIVAILAAASIPEFVRYTRRSRIVEAMEALDKIAAGAQVYYSRTQKLPASSPNFVPLQTLADACANFNGIIQPAAGEWDVDPWISLMFQMSENPRYRYQWTHDPKTGPPTEGNAYAEGDLDCDGEVSLWRVRFVGNREGSLDRAGPYIFMGDPIE